MKRIIMNYILRILIIIRVFVMVNIKFTEAENDSCKGWIVKDGYLPNLNDFVGNYQKAQRRNISDDNNISIWTSAYATYICKIRGNVLITPEVFCVLIGQENSIQWPFMSRSVTKLSCTGWILLNGYTNADNTQGKNFELAVYQLGLGLHDVISKWAADFATYLSNNNADKGPQHYCKVILNLEDNDLYFYNGNKN